MRITEELSSQKKDRSAVSNRAVAEQCIKNNTLLKEIAEALSDEDHKLAADCAEVFTFVSEKNPKLAVRYIPYIIPLLKHKHTKVRWEAMHTLSLLAAYAPEAIESILPDLEEIVEKESSTIVADYAVQTIANYGGTDRNTAKSAFPYLKKALYLRKDKQAHHVFEGMQKVFMVLPTLKKEIILLAETYTDSPRAVVKKAAVRLIKFMQ